MSKDSGGRDSAKQRITKNISFDKGLPSSVEAERLVLGAIQLDGKDFHRTANVITADDFSLHKHKIIYAAMERLASKTKTIDRVTVAHELMRAGELDAVDGLTYLSSLDEGLPQLYSFDAYVRIIKEKSLLRETILTAYAIVQRGLLDSEGPDEIAADAASKMIDLAARSQPDASAGPERLEGFLETYEGGLATFIDPTRRKKGLMTGLRKIDDWTGGLRPGEFIVITGLTGSGKSAWMSNIMSSLCVNGGKVGVIFSLEMSKEMLFTRIVCEQAKVDQLKFRHGYMNTDERYRFMSASTSMAESKLFIDDTSNISLVEMTARMQAIKIEHGLDIAAVDYIQLVKPSASKNDNRAQEVAAVTRGLKILSRSLGIPIIGLSQLRGSAVGQKPKFPALEDLKESTSIGQDADLVMGVFRGELYHQDRQDLKGLAEVGILKQRNGPLGRAKVVFLGPIGKFENIADDREDDTPLIDQ